jgi:hypothetical protein
MVYLAPNLSTVKEWSQDQSSCFGGKVTETHATTTKKFLGWSSGEDGFCSSETKRYRRKATKPDLFFSTRRLQKLKPQPRKFVSGLSSSEDVFCNSEIRRTAPTPMIGL